MPHSCRLALVLAALLLPGPALAQTGTVRGFVTEARSEGPLQGANVSLLVPGGETRGTVTDGDGYFRIPAVPAGEQRIVVTYIGFRSYNETIRVPDGETITLRVVLEESAEVMEEVVIEAEGGSGVAAVTAGLQAIRPRDVARVPIHGASGDLAAYVQSVPGVVLPGDRGGRFHIRGGSDDQNLVLVEGIPIYGAFHILSLYSAFPDEVIDQADFYTAGFGARYGERLSSVLDVRTRNGNKQAFGGSASLSPFLSGVRLEGPIIPGRASVLLSGRRSLVGDLMPSVLGQNMPYRFGDGFGKVHAFLGSGNSLSVFGLLSDDEGQIAGTQYTFDGELVRTPATDSLDLRWDNRVVGGTYRLEPGWGQPVRAEFTVGHSRWRSYFGPTGEEARQTGLQSLDIRLDLGFVVSGVDVRLGTLRRSTDVTYRLDDPFREEPEAYDRNLVERSDYAQLDIPLRAIGLWIQPGLRAYAVGEEPLLWEPRVRSTLELPGFDGTHRLTAAWGRMHQSLVGLVDERDVGNPFAVWTVSETDRPVPLASHAVVGWNAAPFRDIQVAVEVFEKRFEHLQVPVFSAFPTFTTALQEADGRARGVDVRVSFENVPGPYDARVGGWVSYALGEVEYETASGTEYPPAHDRRHSVQAVVDATKDDLAVVAQVQVGSGLPYTPSSGFDTWYLMTPGVDVASDPGRQRVLYAPQNSERLPLYARLDLWIERRIDRGRSVITLRAGGTNVFNRANLFYFDLFTYRRVDQLPFMPSVGVRIEFR
jgi:hypothetical protein